MAGGGRQGVLLAQLGRTHFDPPGASVQSTTLQTVDLDPEEGHDLLKMLVVPRPVAWVTTRRPNGLVNLAPFASYTILGFAPLVVGLAFARKHGEKKDTLRNIEHARQCVIHPATEEMLQHVVGSAWSAPAEVSKAAGTGLTLLPCDTVDVPRIAECAAALECHCLDIHRIGTGHDLVIARVDAVHLDPACFPGGVPDYTRFRPVGRLHDEWFATLGEIREVRRRAPASAAAGG